MTDPFARPSDPYGQESELTVPLAQSPAYSSPTPWPATEETLIDPGPQAQSWQWDAQPGPTPTPPRTGAGADYPSPAPGSYPAYAPVAGAVQPYPSTSSTWSPNVPYAYSEAALPEHPSATPALVLGILSIVGVIPLGPLAWYLGAKGQREMRENPGRWRPSGSLTAGVILGVISTIPLAMGLVALLVFVGLLVIGA